jgi:protein-S-isoprenylcysteine O-methyltransferase Ste14
VRWLPLAGVVLLLGVITWRSWWQHRRYGSGGVLLFTSQRWPEKVRDALTVVLVLLLVGQAVIAAVRPEWLAFFSASDLGAGMIAYALGVVLLFGGIGLVLVAQLNLGASWRIGIPEGARPGLVTHGFYRFCRNPIYFAVLVVLVGYMLVLPTRLSVVMLVGTFVGIRQQVLTEEAYLIRTYGDAYRAYARQVGRFVPGLGTLR